MFQKQRLLLVTYFLAFGIYSIFSYSLADPNLVLINNATFWSFQQWMWEHVFSNKTLLVSIYGAVITLLFALYWQILKLIKKDKSSIKIKHKIFYYLIVISPLFFAYNALSHDVFNYIFNARILLKYGVDPHVTPALTFATDPWLRFMHNTHTTAPYGKGWTYLSLIPYLLGAGKFILTWLSFRLLSIISIIGLYFSLHFFSLKVLKQRFTIYQAVVLFLNPLFIIEVVANQHNDLWMMFPAIAGLGIVTFALFKSKVNWLHVLVGLVLWFASIYIKLASIALLPVLFLVIGIKLVRSGVQVKIMTKWPKMLRGMINKYLDKYTLLLLGYLPDLAAMLMFIPLLTSRSQRFHPWYLLWMFVWIPLTKVKLLREVALLFSVTSLVRYIPWLYQGGYTPEVLFQQRLITWAIPVLYLIIRLNAQLFMKNGMRSYFQRLR